MGKLPQTVMDMDDKTLISELKVLHDAIWVVDCFSVSDLRWYATLCEEVKSRGYEVTRTNTIKVEKSEE